MPNNNKLSMKKKNKVRQRGRAVVYRSPQEPSMRIALRYDAFGALSEASANAGAIYTFRVNSLFDPDLTSAGKQPLGFDQYAAVFNRYRVERVRFDVSFSALDNTVRSVRVGCYPTSSSTLPSDPEAWPAQYLSRSQIRTWPYGRVARFSGTIPLEKFFGISKKELTDVDFSAIPSASPVRIAYLHLYMSSILSGLTGTSSFVINLWFDTEFSDRLPLALS